MEIGGVQWIEEKKRIRITYTAESLLIPEWGSWWAEEKVPRCTKQVCTGSIRN